MPWTRASELDRAVVCPASTHLDRVVPASESLRDAAAWGDLVHKWKETGKWDVDTVATRRRSAALAAGGVSREDLWPDTGAHEVAFALHTKNRIAAKCDLTTREEREAWKLSFNDEWITGTADYVGVHEGHVWVDDLKTGNPDYLPRDPWDAWQLKFYALCAALAGGTAGGTADFAYVSITSWPRYPADGIPNRVFSGATRVELLGTVLPLLEHARVAALVSRDLSVDAVAGDHCKFCKSAPVCPARLV